MPKPVISDKVRIEDLTNLGAGVCRINGVVTFVQRAVDGDVCRVEVIKHTKSYDIARIAELVEPSPYREARACPALRCGGCVYQGVTYAHELELKRRRLTGELKKQGLELKVKDVTSDNRVSGWRNKVQYPVAGGKMGYFAPHSHEIVECGRCDIADRRFDAPTEFARAYVASHPLPALRHVCFRAGSGGLMAGLVTRDASDRGVRTFAYELSKRFPELKSVMLNLNSADTNVIYGSRSEVYSGASTIADEVCGLSFGLSLKSFWQVNRPMAEKLYERAAQLCAGSRRLLDLFCGVGAIGLCVKAKNPGLSLTGVELEQSAVSDARRSAAANGIEAEFIAGDADALKAVDADTVVLDPPRGGVSPALIAAIAASGAVKVVYVSCGPDALARDLKTFLAAGFASSPLEPFDLFPRTGHVETVVALTRVKG